MGIQGQGNETQNTHLRAPLKRLCNGCKIRTRDPADNFAPPLFGSGERHHWITAHSCTRVRGPLSRYTCLAARVAAELRGFHVSRHTCHPVGVVQSPKNPESQTYEKTTKKNCEIPHHRLAKMVIYDTPLNGSR